MKKLSLCFFLATVFVSAGAQDKQKSSAIASTQTFTIKSSLVGPFCPTKLVAGDRDFAGRGPEIWASASISFNSNAVIALIKFRAKELQGGDNSETTGTKLEVLYKAPAGQEITAVTGGKSAEVHFISKSPVTSFAPGTLARTLNANSSSVVDKNDGLVQKWEIYGDTNGPDISDNNNCDDNSRISVTFNALNVTLKPTAAAQGITTVKLENIDEWLVPNKLVRGDREFDGHGPRIKSEVKLRISPDGSKLFADVTFWAQETVHDWSTTEGQWTKLVYEAPYGKKITEIISDKASRTQFVSPAAGFQFIVPGQDLARAMNTFFDATDIQPAVMKAFGVKPEDRGVLQMLVKGVIDKGNTVVQVPPVEGTLVKFFHIVGDTGGPDISNDDNGNDDTRIVKIEFFPAKLKLVDAR